MKNRQASRVVGSGLSMLLFGAVLIGVLFLVASPVISGLSYKFLCAF